MKLLFHPNSQPSRTCVAVAHELGLELETQVIKLMKGEQRSPEYLAINPNGKVPALVDGDLKLWESHAIQEYMVAKAGGSELFPKDPARRADIQRWRSWANTTWNRPLGTITYQNLFMRMFQMGTPDDAAIAAAQDEFRGHAQLLQDSLGEGPWVTGENCTLADFSLGSMLTYWKEASIPLDEFPQLLAWYERLSARESWKASAPKLPDSLPKS